jgi:hypothetical protein
MWTNIVYVVAALAIAWYINVSDPPAHVQYCNWRADVSECY